MLLFPFVILTLAAIASRPDPKFSEQVVDNNVSIGYGLAIGDVDGDSKPDILLADKKQFVWYRNGDWKRFIMIDNLTEADNVCIAARDIDGDGKVEVAVGAQWNPSETSDTTKSGSVHFLIRPVDPTQKWTPRKLHHEPTVHRMRWVKADAQTFHLVVLPLHGRGNKNGEGEGVKVFAYHMPTDPSREWSYSLIDQSMHLTHNFDVVAEAAGESIYLGGKEGIKVFSFVNGKWMPSTKHFTVKGKGFGEVRVGKNFIAGIEPMHGNELTVYNKKSGSRFSLSSSMNQGHALAVDALLNTGEQQIIAGWREPDQDKKTGIKMYVAENKSLNSWTDFWIDENGMACEDLQVADLDGDGKKDIIAAGRATHNLKIYWNKSK